MIPNEYLSNIRSVISDTKSVATQISYMIRAKRADEEGAFQKLDVLFSAAFYNTFVVSSMLLSSWLNMLT